jgi:indoleamine 2,3-dioxygenase
MLKIAPVLTFADTVLWNWDPIADGGLVTMENVRYSQTFSKTEDEGNFYVYSARAELRGVELLQLFTEYHSIPDHSNPHAITRIARILHRMAAIVNEITEIMRSVRNEVDPHVFYGQIRPWFEGSRAGGPSDPVWVYDGVPNSDQLDLSGPSAGQSSVMHALDIFLDVDHKLQQSRSPAPSSQNKKSDLGFMERMRRYMPGRHRDYLNALGSTPRPLRELARRTPALREPYDSVISALKHLRDMHMRIAVIYVVSMSLSQPLDIPQCPVAAAMLKKQREQNATAGPVRGTGGNALSILLKAGRDATNRAALKGNI